MNKGNQRREMRVRLGMALFIDESWNPVSMFAFCQQVALLPIRAELLLAR